MEEYDYYRDGATFAQEVQEALKAGKTFDEALAYPPERAAHIRDIAQADTDPLAAHLAQWWDGYVSRWD